MIVIAEAGATKIQWGIIVDKKLIEFNTSGFNPNVADRNYLRQLLISGFPSYLNPDGVTTVAYYGAGCGSEAGKNEVLRALNNFFMYTHSIAVYSDLEAVASIAFNHSQGYVGVIGTGASFAFYNGVTTEMIKPSLGFLLGDEGSGAWLGKQLLSKIILRELPLEIEKDFYNTFNTFANQHDLIKGIYSHKNQSAFCALFVPFIKERLDNNHLVELVDEGFSVFTNRYIIPTIRLKGDHAIALVGSVAFYFSDVLIRVFERNQIATPLIIEKPFYELVKNYQ